MGKTTIENNPYCADALIRPLVCRQHTATNGIQHRKSKGLIGNDYFTGYADMGEGIPGISIEIAKVFQVKLIYFVV